MLELSGAEFMLRFVLHILPHGMARVRHSGLFHAAKRKDRLATCRELLAMTKRESTASSNTQLSKTPTGSEFDLTEEGDEEAEAPKASKCQCRYCKGEMELVGRLRGTESMWIMNVAQQIVLQITLLLPVINEATVRELLLQVRSCWLTLRFLPKPIRDLLRGQRFTSLEMAGLEARLLHELCLTPLAVSLGLDRKPKETPMISTSGIPPPALAEVVAST